MKGIFIIILLALMLSKSSFAQTCDYRVEIMADGEEFKKEDFKWRMMATKIDGKSTNITGTAEIKSDGKTIKSYKPWTSASISRQKTSSEYSPNLKPGEYEIKAMIEVECDDSDMENNKDTKKITIEGEKEETTASKSKSEDIEAENKDTANNENQQDLYKYYLHHLLLLKMQNPFHKVLLLLHLQEIYLHLFLHLHCTK